MMEKDELMKMLGGEQVIATGAPCTVTVGGRDYHVRQIGNTVRRKISNLEKEAYLIEQKYQDGYANLREAKRNDKKIRTLHSKTAAYYTLGNWALFIPFLFAIKWRILDLRDSEVTFRINEAGANSKGMDFFLANWQITKAALAISTRLVGDGIEQYRERMASVESMLAKDASGISKDNK